MKVKSGSFEEGVLYAAALLNSMHDQPDMAGEILKEAGHLTADCSALDEYDKQNLRVLKKNNTQIKLRGLRPARAEASGKEAQDGN